MLLVILCMRTSLIVNIGRIAMRSYPKGQSIMLGLRQQQRSIELPRLTCQGVLSIGVAHAMVKVTCSLATNFARKKDDRRDFRSSITGLPLSCMSHACTPDSLRMD